jgi:hypothetical protein
LSSLGREWGKAHGDQVCQVDHLKQGIFELPVSTHDLLSPHFLYSLAITRIEMNAILFNFTIFSSLTISLGYLFYFLPF